MSTIKPEIFALCKEVATEFPGWTFVGGLCSGSFKNKTLKHTDLVVWPGFMFSGKMG